MNIPLPGDLCTVGDNLDQWLPLLYKSPEDIHSRLFGEGFLTVTRTVIRGDQIVMFLSVGHVAYQPVYRILWQESVYYTLTPLHNISTARNDRICR